MMETRIEQICRDAIRTFGEDSQKRKAIEEMAELTDALLKNDDGRKSERDVVSEIADVLICASQLGIIFGMDEVTEMVEFKLARLSKTLEELHDGERRFIELMKGGSGR